MPGRIAGLEVLRILNEPTAAALAYGFGMGLNQRVAVYDFGGGTFDVSILEIGDGVFEVLSTNGDTHLGGDDFDEKLIRLRGRRVQEEESGIDVRNDRWRSSVSRKPVRRPSASSPRPPRRTSVNLPFITADASGPKHLQECDHPREVRAALSKSLVERTDGPVPQGAQGRRPRSPAEIGEVILVGGSTRIPSVQSMVQTIFAEEPSKGVNPDEVVALGAAIQGGILRR